MSDQNKSKGGLVRKLSKIMGECRYIQKRGFNEFHKYPYATEADVSEKVAPLLSQNNIMIFPSILEKDVLQVTTFKGKSEILVTLLMEFTIEDGDTGEVRSIRMGGQGQDAGDKAIYKAETGAQKYAILKLLQIETGLDPENDNGRADNQSGGQQQPNNQTNAERPQNNQQGSQRPNTTNNTQNSSRGQNRQPQQQSNRQSTPPGYGKAKDLAQEIGWSLTDMMRAINDLRKKKNLDPVEKWNELDNDFKNQFFDKMKKRRDQGGQQQQSSNEPPPPGEDPPPPGDEDTSVPDSGDIADMLEIIGMDLIDFIKWVNKYRELRKSPKVNDWDNLNDEWKMFIYQKLHEKLNKSLEGSPENE